MKKTASKKKASPSKTSSVPGLRSVPEEVHLSPQSELPRHELGRDASGRQSRVRELSWATFDRMVQAMARELRAFHPEAVVGVAHGGVFVGGAVAGALRCDFYPVRISRRSRDKLVRKSPRMFGKMPPELRGKRVLVVDDVAASGETLELAKRLAQEVGSQAVRTACLVSRTDGYAPDYSGLACEEFCVFPWDYALVADSRFLPEN